MPVQPSEEITVANLVTPTPPAATEPAPAPVLTPAQQAHQRLVDEYELPDSSYNPDTASVPSPVPQPVPAVASPEPAAPTKPQHSARAVRLAQQFGIPQVQIDATSPDALKEALAVMTSQALEDRQRLMSLQPQRGSADAAPAAAAPAPTPKEFDLGITPEQAERWDPDFLAVVKKMGEEIKVLRQLIPQVDSMAQREQVRERESFQVRCDNAFSKFEATLGKGSYGELDPNGPHLRRRQAVLDTAARDTSKVPFETKIARAVEALFGTQPAVAVAPPAAAPEPGKVLPRDDKGRITGAAIPVDQWNQAASARPTHRETPALPPGRERAVAAVAEAMKQKDFFAQEGANGVPVIKDIDTLPD